MFSANDIVTTNEQKRFERKDQALQAGESEARELTRRRAVVEASVRVRGLSEFYDLRKKWSRWIIIWISVLILFNGALAVAVGREILDFKEYQWFISAVTVETFLQIVGMGYVAVKFLFSEPKVN